MKSTSLLVASLLFATAVTAIWLSRPKKLQGPTQKEFEAITAEVIRALQTPEGRDNIRQTYLAACASCHGPELQGNVAQGIPALNGASLQAPDGALRIVQKIMKGGQNMPSFRDQLSLKQILALSLWLRFQNTPEHGGAAGAAQDTWSISGEILLGTLAEKNPNGVIFLFGKTNPEMRGPPLLVQKFPVSAKISFTLGPENVMAAFGGGALGIGTTVFLSARLDLDGNPMTSEGEPQTKALKITLKKKIYNLKLNFKEKD